jgi:hypothetical protein
VRLLPCPQSHIAFEARVVGVDSLLADSQSGDGVAIFGRPEDVHLEAVCRRHFREADILECALTLSRLGSSN